MTRDPEVESTDIVDQRGVPGALAALRALCDGRLEGRSVVDTCTDAIRVIEALNERLGKVEADLSSLQEIASCATTFKINRLFVVHRGDAAWAVSLSSGSGDDVFNRSGGWEWEPQPSSRSDDFIARTRFSLEEAVRHAREQSEVLRIAEEVWLNERAARRAAKASLEASQVQGGAGG